MLVLAPFKVLDRILLKPPPYPLKQRNVLEMYTPSCTPHTTFARFVILSAHRGRLSRSSTVYRDVFTQLKQLRGEESLS